jgi:hypothetical protein
MERKCFFLVFILFSLSISAEEKFFKETSFTIGMANISFAEQAKTLEGDNVDEPASGSSSIISGNVKFDFMHKIDKNFYASATFPLLPAPDVTYFGAGLGVVFYLNNLSTKLGLQHSGTTVKFLPKFRYYWGVEVGGGFLSYQTESAKKSDFLFEFGPMGGLKYAFTDKYILETNIIIKRGTGVVTDSLNVFILLGGTFFLDWF